MTKIKYYSHYKMDSSVAGLFLYAKLAQLAYARRMTVDEVASCGIPSIVEIVYRKSDCGAEVHAIVTDKTLYFVFTGSDDALDWYHDAQLARVQFADASANVHKGFMIQYKSVQGFIRELSNKFKSLSIVAVGHSSGAALSFITKCDISHFVNAKVDCIGFGCPRIGDKAFAAYVTQSLGMSLRVVNDNDLISSLPSNLRGYRHCGLEVTIRSPTLWNSIRRWAAPLLYRIEEHYIATYVKILDGMAAPH